LDHLQSFPSCWSCGSNLNHWFTFLLSFLKSFFAFCCCGWLETHNRRRVVTLN
jgi:hypothetical protein